MTRRRWIADEVSGNKAALSGPHADHLTRVLRARVGQEFDIVANGIVRRGTVSGISDTRVEFELGDEIQSPSSALNLTLLLAIFKFDRMEWAIEKCTELGVARILPVIAARTEKHLAQAASKRVERWRKIARQAAEQSRQVFPPEVPDPVKLAECLRAQGGLRVVLSEVETSLELKNALAPNAPSLTLAFGPEGGWRDDELADFVNAGWTSASLGSTILRAETAVIAAVAVCGSMLNSERR